jgi:hypothetical protein
LKGEKNGMFGKTGEQNPFYNKKHSTETLKLLSEINTGKKHSLESRQKMSSKRQRGNHNGSKKVIDNKTKQIFNCLRDAAEFNNINYSTLRNWLNPKNTSQNKSNLEWL